jgi:cytochrome c oxidase subunit 3
MRVQTPSFNWPPAAPQFETDTVPGYQIREPELQPWDTASSVPAPSLALWVVIVTVTMLFAGFISAYLIRRSSGDWAPIYSPNLLLVNTAVIVASSLVLELGRRQQAARYKAGMLLGTGLGIVFVIGQIAVWRELANVGIFLPSSPHGSFFFMLSSVHAVHVLGGVGVLLYALRKSLRIGIEQGALVTKLASTYWHFVTGIWIALYLLLFVWD